MRFLDGGQPGGQPAGNKPPAKPPAAPAVQDPTLRAIVSARAGHRSWDSIKHDFKRTSTRGAAEPKVAKALLDPLQEWIAKGDKALCLCVCVCGKF